MNFGEAKKKNKTKKTDENTLKDIKMPNKKLKDINVLKLCLSLYCVNMKSPISFSLYVVQFFALFYQKKKKFFASPIINRLKKIYCLFFNI